MITDSMDSKELVALLKDDFAFEQHKYDETYNKYLKLACKNKKRKKNVLI